METQVWTKSEEKFANILTLRGPEVHQLKVTGNMLTMKRNLAKVQEALASGRAPAESGAKVVGTLDARTITKAELSPGNGSLTLHGPADRPGKVSFSPEGNTADAILRAVLAESGRTFGPTEEEIGVVEALIPPAISGAIVGGVTYAIYDSALKVAAGEELEVNGIRRRGLKRMFNFAAETLGTTGSLVIGGVLGLLILAWAVRRITHRPKRTVWLPAPADAIPAA